MKKKLLYILLPLLIVLALALVLTCREKPSEPAASTSWRRSTSIAISTRRKRSFLPRDYRFRACRG